MDIREYISSGILEAYVLGGLSSKERQEVECMSSIYEEISAELTKLQSGFEQAARANAVDPPAGLKASIMEAIKNTPQDHIEEESSKEAPIVALNTTQKKSNVTMWRAAAIVLVVVSAGLGFLYTSNRGEVADQSERIASLEETISSQKESIDKNENQLSELTALNDFISDKQTKLVTMPGLDIAPDAGTRVYYNPTKKQVALQVDFLPETPSDKQYQLWAIVDGKPTDMGVLDKLDSDQLLMVDYDYGTPEAFAITLEKAGGSPQPDLSNLYVYGAV